jgi:hypothetical protein
MSSLGCNPATERGLMATTLRPLGSVIALASRRQ